MTEINVWDVWLAVVKFEDTTESKQRPVVITSAGTAFILAIKVTSHSPRNAWGEYALLEWQYAGLLKPSTVRISQQLALCPTDMVRRIGALHHVDVINIQRVMAERR